MDSCGIGEQIAGKLKIRGQVVTQVWACDSFIKTDDDSYSIRPDQREHYEKLMDQLFASGRILGRVLHLWSLGRENETGTNLTSFEKAQPLGFYSLLSLAQALGAKGIKDEVQLDVIFNHVQEVTGNDRLEPEKSTILGPCRVIPQEYPNVACRSIDVTFPDSKRARNQLTAQLLNELTSRPSNDAIAFRGNHRWVRSLEPVSIQAGSDSELTLRQQGSYVITGGLSGIGLVLANTWPTLCRQSWFCSADPTSRRAKSGMAG